jgi:addiction module RelE/StbE family toxin
LKVRWLLAAVADLESLRAYVSRDKPSAARSEVTLVVDAVGRLADLPASGRAGRVAGTRELPISSYIVAYRAKDGWIEVLRVLHASRKWPKGFPPKA